MVDRDFSSQGRVVGLVRNRILLACRYDRLKYDSRLICSSLRNVYIMYDIHCLGSLLTFYHTARKLSSYIVSRKELDCNFSEAYFHYSFSGAAKFKPLLHKPQPKRTGPSSAVLAAVVAARAALRPELAAGAMGAVAARARSFRPDLGLGGPDLGMRA